MNADNDRELIGLGIGFTNIVERTTRASQELTRQEIEEGESGVIIVIAIIIAFPFPVFSSTNNLLIRDQRDL